MPEEDMNERRRRKFGPPDVPEVPRPDLGERFPGIAEASAGGGAGGGPVSWEVTYQTAMNLAAGGGRDALLKAAKKKAEAALYTLNDPAEMTAVAVKIAEIEALIGNHGSVGAVPNPVAPRPEAGGGNREVVRIEGELMMKLRGHIIAAIINGNVDENALNSGVTKFVADNVLKRADFIVINENDRKLIEEEIKARVELQKVSNYWVSLKNEPLPLNKLRETVSSMAVLSPVTETWLEKPNHNCSYIDEETGQRISITDLAGEIGGVAKKLRERMEKPIGDPEVVNLWKFVLPRDYLATARKLTNKTNAGVLTLQMAEAGIWAAGIEIPGEGFRHPAADIVKYARTRFLAASKGKPTLNGHRLYQEFQDSHRGAVPGNEDVFSPEGGSLGRTELNLWMGAEQALVGGRYLAERKNRRSGAAVSYSEEVKADLEAACLYLTVMNELTAAEATLDPGSLVGKFFKVKTFLTMVATRFSPPRFVDDVDVNEAERKRMAGLMTTESVKTGIWANSLLNKWNLKSVLNMPDLYEVGRLTISSQTDSGEPLYVGSSPSAEEAKRVNIEFVNWFGKLWDKYEPIITNKEGNPVSRLITPLGSFFLRNDIPKGINANNRGIFDKNRWISLLTKGMVTFARGAATRNKLMGLEK